MNRRINIFKRLFVFVVSIVAAIVLIGVIRVAAGLPMVLKGAP